MHDMHAFGKFSVAQQESALSLLSSRNKTRFELSEWMGGARHPQARDGVGDGHDDGG